ncbi:hypothetical protein P7C70_g6178, partial [Phenoliferia sp. Uapishka_3]
MNGQQIQGAAEVKYRPRRHPRHLRIAFIHPDLGIGGAERLVVDAAIGLQKRGHTVSIFTSHHQDGPTGRSFEETRSGILKVHVLGNSIFPSSIFGHFTIICAILRQLHLTFSFLLASFLYFLSSIPPSNIILHPLRKPFKSSADWSPRRQLAPFDVIVVDQLSACIPLLRWIGGNRIVFYCHFPDLLLSPSRSASEGEPIDEHDEHGEGGEFYSEPWSPGAFIRNIYRLPFDKFEEVTTGEADKILVNSEFTSRVFERTFASLARIPRVVYPGIDVDAYGEEVKIGEDDEWLVEDGTPTFLSINRFESKKDVELAVEAFGRARGEFPSLRLVIAGGYDDLLSDNHSTLSSLQSLATSLSLTHYTFCSSPIPTNPTISSSPPPSPPQILLLLNMSSAHKSLLLSSPTTIALLYTPSFEHFGIVPLEAMASGLPVLATRSGGPMETIIDAGLDSPSTTGLLRVPSAEVWATALKDLLSLPSSRRKEIGEQGKKRTKDLFSVGKLAEEMERACKDAAGIGAPITGELGFLKICAGASIGFFVFGAGFAVWLSK